MTSGMTAPATKLDISLLMNEIGKLYDANERWKDELHEGMEKWKNELRLHFDFCVEQFKEGIKTINIEKIEEHGTRLTRLELHTGLPRAA